MSINNKISSVLQDTITISEEESAGEMIWPSPTFDKCIKTNPQFIRKKRVHSASFSHSGTNGLTIGGVPSDLQAVTMAMHRVQLNGKRLPYGKNSRKSRDGRRIPKKRGGKAQNDSKNEFDEIELDPDDPDYDSDANISIIFDEVQPTLSDEAFEKLFTSLLREYFEHGKTQEVIDGLTDINLSSHQRRRIVYLAIVLAIQHKQTQCELTSELFSDMFERILNQTHIQQGFQLILNDLGDLVIDVPKSHEYVGRFIARAITDDIIPSKFIDIQRSVFSAVVTENLPRSDAHVDSTNGIGTRNSVFYTDSFAPHVETHPGTRNLSDSSTGGMTLVDTSSSGIGSISSLTTPTMLAAEISLKALARAEGLLTLRHAFSRLGNIWGVPAGPRITNILVKKICLLLKSFLATDDISEATEALLELDSPHFHHELVYQAVNMSIELSTDLARDQVVRLLNDLCHSVVLTWDQLTLGIRRVYSELPDLKLDVPNAYQLMDRFMRSATQVGFMPKTLAQEISSKQRKRFMSETDSVYRSGKPW